MGWGAPGAQDAREREAARLIHKHEGDLQRCAVLRDRAVFHYDFLVFHPGALDILERLIRTLNSLFYRVFETDGGGGNHLSDSCYGH